MDVTFPTITQPAASPTLDSPPLASPPPISPPRVSPPLISQPVVSPPIMSQPAMPPITQPIRPLDETSADDSAASSYVDDYTPPSVTPSSETTSPSEAILTSPVAPPPAADASPPVTPPPATASSQTITPPSSPELKKPASSTPISQALEDQNIFQLLGITDGSQEEREEFLDELQQVIWEDFLENDVELLVTEEEMVELKKIMGRKDLDETKMQEEIITYLEKLIPDLEEIMLEKALELKSDMVKERIAGMREYYAGKDAPLQTLDKAEDFIQESQWRDAAGLLNGISDQS